MTAINENKILQALDAYAAGATANQPVPAATKEEDGPTKEDLGFYLLWAHACLAMQIRQALTQTVAFRSDPRLRKSMDNIERAAKNMAYELSNVNDHFKHLGLHKGEGTAQTRDNVMEVLRDTLHTLVNLEPARADDFACLIANFNADAHRVVDTGVYEVIAQLPESADDRARSLVDMHCKGRKLNKEQRETLAKAITQLAVYERETYLNSATLNTKATLNWIAQFDNENLPDQIPAAVAYAEEKQEA